MKDINIVKLKSLHQNNEEFKRVRIMMKINPKEGTRKNKGITKELNIKLWIVSFFYKY